ncbi:MAG: flagellar biosynthesis repressor FlbT [Rhodothalassiaceae bacterium]
MALKLSLKPGEKFVINGAVIANGDRRATLVVHNKASILRERDIIKEEDVNTPVKRVYFPIMLCYLDPAGEDKYRQEFVLRMNEFMSAIGDPETKLLCVQISGEMMRGNYYKALAQCKKLFAFEKERLDYVP